MRSEDWISNQTLTPQRQLDMQRWQHQMGGMQGGINPGMNLQNAPHEISSDNYLPFQRRDNRPPGL